MLDSRLIKDYNIRVMEKMIKEYNKISIKVIDYPIGGYRTYFANLNKRNLRLGQVIDGILC
jgi:hypothetical protein